MKRNLYLVDLPPFLPSDPYRLLDIDGRQAQVHARRTPLLLFVPTLPRRFPFHPPPLIPDRATPLADEELVVYRFNLKALCSRWTHPWWHVRRANRLLPSLILVGYGPDLPWLRSFEALCLQIRNGSAFPVALPKNPGVHEIRDPSGDC